MNKGEFLEVANPTEAEFSWADAELDVMLTDDDMADFELALAAVMAGEDDADYDDGYDSEEQSVPKDLDQQSQDLDSLATYFAAVGKEKLLTPEEERELAQRLAAGNKAKKSLAAGKNLSEARKSELTRIAEDGTAARHGLVLGNLRLVVRVAKPYVRIGMPLEDLIQEGNFALYEAADKFDATRGKFSNFAPWIISKHLRKGLIEQSRNIKWPHHVVKALTDIDGAKYELMMELGRTPTPKEIAARVGLEPEKFDELRQIREPASIDTLMFRKNGDNRVESLKDHLKDEAGSPVERAVNRRHLRAMINAALNDLPENEAKVIRLKYGMPDQKYGFEDFGEERMDKEVAEEMGKSREWVRLTKKKIDTYLQGSLRTLLEPYVDDMAS